MHVEITINKPKKKSKFKKFSPKILEKMEILETTILGDISSSILVYFEYDGYTYVDVFDDENLKYFTDDVCLNKLKKRHRAYEANYDYDSFPKIIKKFYDDLIATQFKVDEIVYIFGELNEYYNDNYNWKSDIKRSFKKCELLKHDIDINDDKLIVVVNRDMLEYIKKKIED